MKFLSKIAAGTILFLIGFSSYGQDTQEFNIPLSNPSSPGKLYAKTHRGSIVVNGYNGKEVIVKVNPREDEHDHDSDRDRGRDLGGMKRIPNTAAQFEIIEEDNVVKVQGVHNKYIDFEIQVPKNFDLSINTHHDGYIEVNGVTGEIEADGHHESIVLTNVAGSVIADTHHGEIKVNLTSATSNTPMAFSTYHGDIDITLPANINAATKIKTTKGDVYTDFDLDLRVESTEVESGRSGGTQIKVGGWLVGNLGKGGPEFLFNTYHGDVIIRKD